MSRPEDEKLRGLAGDFILVRARIKRWRAAGEGLGGGERKEGYGHRGLRQLHL
jgi:hypothetical protein